MQNIHTSTLEPKTHGVYSLTKVDCILIVFRRTFPSNYKKKGKDQTQRNNEK